MTESPVKDFVKVVAVESAKSAAITAGASVLLVGFLIVVGKAYELKQKCAAK